MCIYKKYSIKQNINNYVNWFVNTQKHLFGFMQSNHYENVTVDKSRTTSINIKLIPGKHTFCEH